MKIKLTKEKLDKMILESLEDKINSDIEEVVDETNPNELDNPNEPKTKGIISFDELLTPGRFYRGDDM